MTETQTLAAQHPYTQTPSASQMGQWASCFCIGAVLGLFCVNPDAGDYGAWEAQAHALIQRFGAAFAAQGCTLTLERTRDYFFQIIIDPYFAVGKPVQKGP
ncbi:hypothetical protein ACKKBG_A31540 [Auxenochlorella protothecoides x Auxenochlorella symbiontica]|nr:hypothetical protein F751_0319 [Auxenochlorella protothecoides]KFM28578.1 hypothetical protein F751_0319 [Auxenochlorella protothecoides]